ncbi:MAG: hypothetical protein M1814_001303 [Vezdaea aestivalis]|nr:MAG: hypothetical protein M1814_001303 [Vezdaea aestivalis]
MDSWVRNDPLQATTTSSRKPRKPRGARAWPSQHDPWPYPLDDDAPNGGNDDETAARRRETERMMELNGYDAENVPRPAFEVFSQRLSLYIQHRDSTRVPFDVGDENPYENPKGPGHPNYLPNIETLDNGNVIIIFENSQTSSVHDTLIAARKEWESRWRRLPFYLSFETEFSDDDSLAIACMKSIVQDIFTSMTDNWETLLEIAETHVGILEDKIYSSPDDETRATELWTNSYNWMKIEKLAGNHFDASMQFERFLIDMLNFNSANEDQSSWLPAIQLEWQRISNFVQEGLVKPTANLADLMYKSVGFRDTRLNLELSTSVWRLTWIATIFLPLTFVSSVFSMQISLLADPPSIKWYFVVAVPMMVLLWVFYLFAKHTIKSNNQTFSTRSVYSTLFNDLSVSHPGLWTQTGPRLYIRPRTWNSRLKWALIKFWSNPSKTVNAGENSRLDEDAGLGLLSRLKRTWIREWTAQLAAQEARHHPPLKPGQDSSSLFSLRDEEEAYGSTIRQGLGAANDLLVSVGESPSIAQALSTAAPSSPVHLQPASVPTMRIASVRPLSRHSHESKRSSGQGWLVEERNTDWFGGPSELLQSAAGWAGGAFGGVRVGRRSHDEKREDGGGGSDKGKENRKGGGEGPVGDDVGATGDGATAEADVKPS